MDSNCVFLLSIWWGGVHQILLMLASHWIACLWLLTVELEPASASTWLDAFAKKIYDLDSSKELHHLVKYTAALYWACVTITSIGYGDIVPTNKQEMQVVVVATLVGSCLWAYFIGSVCSILSTLDIDKIEHQQRMDQLNEFMRKHDVSANPSNRRHLAQF